MLSLKEGLKGTYTSQVQLSVRSIVSQYMREISTKFCIGGLN